MRCMFVELANDLQTLFLSLQELKEQQFGCPAAECFGELHKLANPVSPKWAAQGTSDTYAFTFCSRKIAIPVEVLSHFKLHDDKLL